MSSDLGGGKTTFAKGLAKGLGSNDTVTSPTFTVGQVYQGRDGIEMHHFDFYRLSEGGMVAHGLAEVMTDPKAVVVVEWGDVISDVLPEQRVTVQLSRVQSGEDYRVLHISYPKPLQYLVEGVSR